MMGLLFWTLMTPQRYNAQFPASLTGMVCMNTEVTDVNAYMELVGRQARAASRIMARATTAQKNAALHAMADAIDERRESLQQANQQDLSAGRDKGLDDAMLDRLALTPARIDTMVEGLRQVATLQDPI